MALIVSTLPQPYPPGTQGRETRVARERCIRRSLVASAALDNPVDVRGSPPAAARHRPGGGQPLRVVRDRLGPDLRHHAAFSRRARRGVFAGGVLRLRRADRLLHLPLAVAVLGGDPRSGRVRSADRSAAVPAARATRRLSHQPVHRLARTADSGRERARDRIHPRPNAHGHRRAQHRAHDRSCVPHLSARSHGRHGDRRLRRADAVSASARAGARRSARCRARRRWRARSASI